MNKQQGEIELLKTAMCSELWAYTSLYDKYEVTKDENTLSQAEDELKHFNMLKGLVLLNGGESDKESTILAMQHILYENVCGIKLPNPTNKDDNEFFFLFHEIMERRAIWIYKTLILSTDNDIIKKVLRQILKDEAGHIHTIPKTNNIRVNNLVAADQWLFKEHLPNYYNNMKLTECERFWEDYWENNIIRADGKQFSSKTRSRQ